jgi:hypothetical protein
VSALPKAVQKQIAQANKIAEEIKKARDGALPKEEPPKQEALQSDPPPATPPATDPPVDDPPSADEKQEDGWEHRYKVLQGKYNKEVPRLQAQLRDNEGAVGELRQRLNTAEALVIALGNSRDGKVEGHDKQPPAGAGRGISEQEIREFGPDLYDFIQRVATSVTAERIKPVEQAASHAVKSVANSARERLFSALAGAVPDWEELNTDPEFLEWLNGADVFSGRRRGDLLAEAYGANDSNRVIQFFTSFQRENAAVTPAGGDAARAKEPQTPKTEPQQNLSDLVAPGTPKTGPAGAQSESGKRVWSRKEISDFYAHRNEFVRKGRKIPESLLRDEADLSKAMRENRVKS